MPLTVYGISNCDTVRKARRWLDARDIGYRFHDVRRDGLDIALLERWIGRVGWEALLNRRGTSFRALAEDRKADLNGARAIALIRAEPAMMKRPVAESGGTLLLGFDEAEWAEHLAA